ncbi:MAG: hypothetical protein VX739_15205 [Planctomycetota bacterium]|nr:hypothetical protein [Planctomycetota bacterium]
MPKEKGQAISRLPAESDFDFIFQAVYSAEDSPISFAIVGSIVSAQMA